MLILKKLRTEKGISLDKLSTDLNINKSTLSRIENGLREPKESFIKDCSDYFGVSTDYLIGKINIDDSNKLTKCLNSTFPIRLKELRKKKELTQAELSKLLNCSLSKIAMLETSKREPVKEDLLRISEFFNVSVDYLLGKTSIENYITTDEISKIIKSYESLPKEAQEHINIYIEFLVDRYKK
ncbi:helix-turn-helix domain-containing protein [Clostridioides difficile]|nr:helix-turn-helix domain-containing protein [Clostridioides difficile]